MTTMRNDETEPPVRGILHPEGMRATRDIASGLAHEINNVLGVIIGNAHLARKHISDAAALERYLDEVRNAAEEGRELMRDLSVLAGDSSLQTRVLSLNDLVRTTVSGLEAPVTLDLSIRDPVARLNLWLAQDALGGVVRFMAATRTVASIRIATRLVGAAVALTIEDDGVSPSDDEIRLMFAPFAKIERRPNVKLMLAKLADLASRSAGFVTAGAREPHGLRIVLTLPIEERAPSGDGPGVPLAKQGV